MHAAKPSADRQLRLNGHGYVVHVFLASCFNYRERFSNVMGDANIPRYGSVTEYTMPLILPAKGQLELDVLLVLLVLQTSNALNMFLFVLVTTNGQNVYELCFHFLIN